MVDGKIAFSLEGSLIDLNTQSIPNFSRPSPMYLERVIEESLQLYAVEAYRPAFYSEDGSFVVEPRCVNLCTWNRDLSQSVWVKGGNVTVRPNNALGADGSSLASTISWIPGDGSPLNQLITRAIPLIADRDYYLSAIVKLRGGQFTNADVIQVTGGVIGTPKVSLSQINQGLNRYALLQLGFHTTGKRPVFPRNTHQTSNYTITAFDASTVTISITADAGVTVVSNQLVGGQITFSNLPTLAYNIIASSPISNSTMVITTNVTTLISDGVTLSSKLFLKDSPLQDVNVQILSNSSAVIDWDSIQLEERNFRTSMNYQEEAVQVRGSTTLSYRRSPLRKAKTFGVYGNLVEWRGDGSIFTSGNISAWIAAGIFYVQAGATVIQSRAVVSNTNLSFLVQVASENASLSLYLNGILEAKTSVANFTVEAKAALNLTSEGLRRYRPFFTTDSILADGQVAIGAAATLDVGNLFADSVLIDPVAIASHAPAFLLPPITIPAPDSPIASSTITALNTGGGVITVVDGTGFIVGAFVTILRTGKVVQTAKVTVKSGNDLTLTTVSSIVIGDQIVYGNVDTPGRIACRFPFDPLASEIIQSVDVGNKRLTLASSLAFTTQRAFIQTSLFQDVTEVLIQSIDSVARTVTIDSVTGISAGMYLSQAENELFVDTPNYFVSLLRSVDNVRIAQKYQNGIVLENRNPYPVIVRPFIRVYL